MIKNTVFTFTNKEKKAFETVFNTLKAIQNETLEFNKDEELYLYLFNDEDEGEPHNLIELDSILDFITDLAYFQSLIIKRRKIEWTIKY